MQIGTHLPVVPVTTGTRLQLAVSALGTQLAVVLALDTHLAATPVLGRQLDVIPALDR